MHKVMMGVTEDVPQWSPASKAGMTDGGDLFGYTVPLPQWSPPSSGGKPPRQPGG